MKKLGIITFNRARNYGAVLQAYAMKSVCSSLGYDVHVIDYNRGADEGPHPIRQFKAAKNKKRGAIKFARSALSCRWDEERWRAFKQFRRQYLNETDPCETPVDVSALGYDAYVSGSDQIWNYNITGGSFDPVYFGDISGEAVHVVYAASAHDTPFPLDKELELKDAIVKTKAAISVREKKLADYVGKVTHTRYPAVLDPTLLAGRSCFEKLAEAQAPQENYILIYQIDANPASDISVKNLEKRFGCSVYTMTVPRIGSIHNRKGTSSPEEFLTLLKNADFLVTNSFHGVALSLLFHKQFFVYENGGVMSRIDDLLETVSLFDRKVKMVADIQVDRQIDYEKVDTALEKRRAESMSFLKDALNGIDHSDLYVDRSDSGLSAMRERKKEDCSGCTACVEICPAGAIGMRPDEEGFSYPVIDEDKCIGCGKCDSFCSFRAPKAKREEELPQAFGIKHRDEKTRLSSRSGGAFVAFSDVILQKGGVIYGAAMEKNGEVHHVRARTRDERDRMKDAKYVQSDLTGVYKAVVEDLTAGSPVLFSGTPCQIAGLTALLDEKKIGRDKLVTCDLVCHGVPSPQIWRDYLVYIRKKYGREIVKPFFRDKTLGWDSHCESFILDNGKKVICRDYTDLYYDHIMFRPSCHKCRYANVSRVGDLTLADFWGIEKNSDTFDDNKGVSLVLINTPKGEEVLSESEPVLDIIKCDIRNCLQPTLVKPSDPSPRREKFWKCYRDNGFPAALKKYGRPMAVLPRTKKMIKRVMYNLHLRPHP